MRILIISNIFPPGFIGGYELGALDVARGLMARGHHVEVLTSDYFLDDQSLLPDIAVRRVLECTSFNRSPYDSAARRLGGFILQRNLRTLSTEILRFRPDRVLCFNLMGLGALGMLEALVGMGIPTTAILMDNIFAEAEASGAELAQFERLLGFVEHLPAVDFVFMSRNLHREVERKLGRPVAARAYVPGWADVAHLPPMTPTPPDITRFVFSSRIAEAKGIHLVLEAARRLVTEGAGDFLLDVYGGGDVGNLQQRITIDGLGRHVAYRGAAAKEDMCRAFASYDALLFPTWAREPFGFVVCEAAAAGCVPVITRGIGAAEWYLTGIDCLKISRSSDALAEAMLSLMRMPRNELAALRQRARSTTRRHLGFDRALDAIEAILPPSRPTPDWGSIRRVEAAMSIFGELWRTTPHDRP